MGNKTVKPAFIEQKSREFSQMVNTLVQDHFATPTCVPLDFLKAITSDFSKEQELGRGGFGVVYKGHLENGKAIAVKKFYAIIMNLDGDQFHNEIMCLSRAKHKNIVRLKGYCDESRGERIIYKSGEHVMAEFRERLLIYECINNNSLDKHLSAETRGVEWHMRYEIIKGICHGLHYLHTECQIVHLDLKPENILLDDNMEPKITDFGMSRQLGLEESKIITPTRGGTRGYMAPEYLLEGLISMKADIFSLGVVIIEVVTGGRNYPSCEESFKQFAVDVSRKIPFQISQHQTPPSIPNYRPPFLFQMVGRWRKRLEQEAGMYIPLEKYVEQVKACILIGLSCVDADPKKRPTTSEIIEKLTKVDVANTTPRSFFGLFRQTSFIGMLKQALKIQDVSQLEQLQAKEMLRELHRIGTNATRNRSFLQRFHASMTMATVRMVLFLALENMHGQNNARRVQRKASSKVSDRSRNLQLGVPKPKLSKVREMRSVWLAACIAFLCGLTLGEMRGLRRARVTNARDAMYGWTWRMAERRVVDDRGDGLRYSRNTWQENVAVVEQA